MNPTYSSRRSFVREITLAATTVTLVQPFVRSIEPFVRSNASRVRLSLAAYSMRKYLGAEADQATKMDLFQFLDYCAQLGLTGAELTSYYFPENFDATYLAQLKRHAHLAGVTISGGAIRNDFCQLPGPNLDKDIAHTRAWIDHYAALGVSPIRIFAGNLPSGVDAQATLRQCAEICTELSDYASKKGVLLALENHGGVTAKADGLLSIVKQVESTGFGVNFDSGNFRSSDDPYVELAAIAPYAVNAQIKVDMYRQGVHEMADIPRILKILYDAGYSGWVALEYEAAEEPRDAIPKWVLQIQNDLANLSKP